MLRKGHQIWCPIRRTQIAVSRRTAGYSVGFGDTTIPPKSAATPKTRFHSCFVNTGTLTPRPAGVPLAMNPSERSCILRDIIEILEERSSIAPR